LQNYFNESFTDSDCIIFFTQLDAWEALGLRDSDRAIGSKFPFIRQTIRTFLIPHLAHRRMNASSGWEANDGAIPTQFYDL